MSRMEFEENRTTCVLKEDLFGRVSRGRRKGAASTPEEVVRREISVSSWWIRPLARHLASREARALRALQGLDGVPRFLGRDRTGYVRSWIEGQPMAEAKPREPSYFTAARRLLIRIHRAGIAHNDLAKEPNWLVRPNGRPAVVDFQIAWVSRRRSRLFRWIAREDLRHLLKHKRTYCPDALTDRERRILARPLPVTRVWRVTAKRAYNLVTRRILRWRDNEGQGRRFRTR